jgi:hypothetical protein
VQVTRAWVQATRASSTGHRVRVLKFKVQGSRM